MLLTKTSTEYMRDFINIGIIKKFNRTKIRIAIVKQFLAFVAPRRYETTLTFLKSNLHRTRGNAPQRVRSGEAHLGILVDGQHRNIATVATHRRQRQI